MNHGGPPPPGMPPYGGYGAPPPYGLPPPGSYGAPPGHASYYAGPPPPGLLPGRPPAMLPMRPPMMSALPMRPVRPALPQRPNLQPPPVVAAMPPPAPRSTTLYVGKIASTLPDSIVRKLLDCCGEVKSWSRQSDPETKQPKAFGFCEMGDADGVLRALRILNGKEIHGQALLVKCNQATQKYIDHYKAVQELLKSKKESEPKQEREEPPAAQGVKKMDEGDAPQEGEEARPASGEDGKKEGGAEGGKEDDKQEDGEEGGKKEDEPAPRLTDEEVSKLVEELLGVPEAAMPPPPPISGADGATRFLTGMFGGGSPSANKPAAEDSEKSLELEREREREREKERARERERRREVDRIFLERERQWDRIEREKEHEARRQERREQDALLYRERLMEQDLVDSDEDEPLHRRRSYFGSQKAKERRKRREAELQQDKESIRREAEEAEAQARAEAEAEVRKEREEAEAAAAKAEAAAEAAEAKAAEEAALAAAAAAAQAAADNGRGGRAQSSQQASTATPIVDPTSDPIYAAMIAAAKAPPPKVEEVAEAGPPAKKKRTGINPAVLAAFKEEEDKPRMALPRFEMDSLPEVSRKDRWDKSANKQPMDMKEELRKIADGIPTSKQGLFKHPIDWGSYKKYDLGQASGAVVKFVGKKVAELLGSEDEYVASFVMEKLAAGTQPADMETELQELFEEQAETFVLKLYRMVIFEMRKAALVQP